MLCNAFADNKSIKIINFSKNFITNKAIPAISNMINVNDNLLEIYLHWNLIRG